MGRLCLWLMLAGSVIAVLTAALFEGLSGPGFGEFYAISSPAGGPVTVSEPGRYLVVAAVGAVVGLLTGVVLGIAGARIDERRRLGVTAVAGLGGCAVGVLPALAPAYNAADLPGGMTPLVLYAVSGAVAYGLAVAAVYWVLRAGGDPAARATARTTAVVLPVGAVVATLAGMGSAWLLGFSTTTSTWLVVVSVVLVFLTVTFAAARVLGIRSHETG
ncbi:hypothetical protein [Gordonia westfalica]|uniref:Uncharacterized protein n=1 Tax=Gordonia westfalica TaxID=158898 RepID=A0A1H2KT81_9ACTN|nr:hypothetical protein [Gordonia westfalica]SDU71879.1 hypothetical protein SAMN04488548_1343678 [Gordonia westfalica]